MLLEGSIIEKHNEQRLRRHNLKLASLQDEFPETEQIIRQIEAFQVAIPSWALGTGGTRFGRFSGGGEPRSLEEKMEDVGLLHQLNRASGAIIAYSLGCSARSCCYQKIG